MYATDSHSIIIKWRGTTIRRFPPHDSYCYLIHFHEPYKHARHYLGSTRNLESRLQLHRTGNGARLMEVVSDAGIPWEVSRLWRTDTREEALALERKLKRRHGSVLLCPICSGKPLDVLVQLRHSSLATTSKYLESLCSAADPGQAVLQSALPFLASGSEVSRG